MSDHNRTAPPQPTNAMSCLDYHNPCRNFVFCQGGGSAAIQAPRGIAGQAALKIKIEDQNLTPHPNPRISYLLRIFRLRSGLEWKFLLRRTWSGQSCSHCNFQHFHSLSKENQVSLVMTFLLSQVQKAKSANLGLGVDKLS